MTICVLGHYKDLLIIIYSFKKSSMYQLKLIALLIKCGPNFITHS